MRRPTAVTIAGLALIAPLTACSAQSPAPAASGSSSVAVTAAAVPTTAPSSTPRASTPASKGPAGATATLKDPHGKDITLPTHPQRIVCLTGICDDALVELGLAPVGSSTHGLLEKPQFLGAKAADVATIPGGFGSEDVESIAKLRPDLVIGLAGGHDQLKPAIETTAPVWLVDVHDSKDSIAYLRMLGTLTGREKAADAGVAAFEASLARAKKASSEKNLKALTVLSMYSAGGSTGVNTSDDILGSLFSQVFTYPWPNKGGDYTKQAAYSTEEIFARKPQVIFMQSYTATPTSPKGSVELKKNPVWARIPAVQAGKVLEVDVDVWTAGRGPRALGIILDQAVAFASK